MSLKSIAAPDFLLVIHHDHCRTLRMLSAPTITLLQLRESSFCSKISVCGLNNGPDLSSRNLADGTVGQPLSSTD